MATPDQLSLNQSLSRDRSWPSLIRSAADVLSFGNLVNAATCLHRLACLSDEGSADDQERATLIELTDYAADCIERAPHRAQPRNLSNLLWACARLQLPSANLARAVARGAEDRVQYFKPQELSNILWALAKLQESAHVELLEELSVAATLALGDFSPQGLANTTWAFGTLHAAAPESLDKHSFSSAVHNRCNEMKPQELSNAIWGLGKLAAPAPQELLEETAQLVDASPKSFSAQNLANIFWGVVKLSETATSSSSSSSAPPVNPYSILQTHITHRCGKFNPHELSMSLWGAASAGLPDPKLHAALAQAAASLVPEFGAQHLSNVAWACARLGIKHSGLMGAVASRAVEEEPQLGVIDVSNLLWGFARLDGGGEADLLECLSRCCLRIFAEDKEFLKSNPGASSLILPQHLANILWAVAKLGLKDKELAKGLRKIIVKRAAELGPRDVANITWAHATMISAQADRPRADLMEVLATQAKTMMGDFNAQELLKFMSAFARAGGADAELDKMLSERRNLTYSFPNTPAAQINLACKAPGRSQKMDGEGLDATDDLDGLKGTGVAAWEATYVLSEWMSRLSGPGASPAVTQALNDKNLAYKLKHWGNLTAVELGAGLGLPSLVANRLGCASTATDGDPKVLELLEVNAEENRAPGGGRARVESLLWGTAGALKTCGLSAPPDVLLAADVVYGSSKTVWGKLLATMLELSGPDTVVLQANMQRYHSTEVKEGGGEARFLEMLKEHFDVVQVPAGDLHPDYRKSNCLIWAMRRKEGGAPVLVEAPVDKREKKEKKEKRKKEKEVVVVEPVVEAPAMAKKEKKEKKRKKEKEAVEVELVVEAPAKAKKEKKEKKHKKEKEVVVVEPVVEAPAKAKKEKKRKKEKETEPIVVAAPVEETKEERKKRRKEEKRAKRELETTPPAEKPAKKAKKAKREELLECEI